METAVIVAFEGLIAGLARDIELPAKHRHLVAVEQARDQFEREYLLYQLKKAGGSVGKLSEAVGMERTHLYRKLRSLGIDPKSVSRGDAN